LAGNEGYALLLRKGFSQNSKGPRQSDLPAAKLFISTTIGKSFFCFDVIKRAELLMGRRPVYGYAVATRMLTGF
jgi:hypothetical protein